MIGMSVNKAKGLFFDSKAVIRQTDKATRRVLSKFGAFVRTRARSSIRKRKRPSAPGQPPSSHTGLLKRFIYFVLEPSRKSVVIGPTKLNKPGGIPEVLEYGGRSRPRPKARRVVYAARPTMRPAFEAERPQLPSLWRDSIRKG